MLFKPVYIEWVDSQTSNTGWVFDEAIEDPEPLLVRSVGFVIRENDAALALAQNDGHDQYSHVLVIPKSAIRKRSFLR